MVELNLVRLVGHLLLPTQHTQRNLEKEAATSSCFMAKQS